jgi:hypothetical protein
MRSVAVFVTHRIKYPSTLYLRNILPVSLVKAKNQPSHEVIDGLMSRDMMRAKQIDLKEGTCGRYWE